MSVSSVRGLADTRRMRLQLDPVRVRSLRTRLGMPLARAAELSRLPQERIEHLEADGGLVEVEEAQRLAKAFNRNWYVFLLEEEPGRPALPHDFRRLGHRRPLSADSLIAFDNAEALVEKILDLPRDDEASPVELPAIAELDAETAAARVRTALGVTVEAQRSAGEAYQAIRFWTEALTRAGLYVAQLSFPYEEVRAFCLRRDRVALIVVSSRDSPPARVFSMLHECGHLLRGGDGMCQPEPTSRPGVPDEEVFCNAFAAALLMPAGPFAADPEAQRLSGRHVELGDAVKLARRWGVSELAALRRLSTVGLLSNEDYERLHEERAREFSEKLTDEPQPDPTAKRIRHEFKRMINENSRLYAVEVLDAQARGDISLREVGVLLGGNLKHLHKLREELRR